MCGSKCKYTCRKINRALSSRFVKAKYIVYQELDLLISKIANVRMSPAEKKLSSTVLEMKFMQRTKLKYEARERRRKEAEARKECFGETEDLSPLQPLKSRDYQYSNDLTFLEGLKFGRMSFKGCNPEVEKLMVYYERKMLGYKSDSDSDDGKDVGDVEMASTLRGASRTIARKFDKTRSLEVQVQVS
ncbi:hypothetical protein OESDEN_04945 [Oesophagostomum dentatum]|uniref:Uncharacterized protein n=1 Tax=Oesophagostomum dentatum TaxID=61180 RepID=A0A0B1TC47_OESDE|nr:hypothetical protein OESDEN_04945 [Oesophagostomum dentatum]